MYHPQFAWYIYLYMVHFSGYDMKIVLVWIDINPFSSALFWGVFSTFRKALRTHQISFKQHTKWKNWDFINILVGSSFFEFCFGNAAKFDYKNLWGGKNDPPTPLSRTLGHWAHLGPIQGCQGDHLKGTIYQLKLYLKILLIWEK